MLATSEQIADSVVPPLVVTSVKRTGIVTLWPTVVSMRSVNQGDVSGDANRELAAGFAKRPRIDELAG